MTKKQEEYNGMDRIDEVVASRNKRIKEIRENDGTLVITDNDAPAGMGAIYPEDLSECKGFPED